MHSIARDGRSEEYRAQRGWSHGVPTGMEVMVATTGRYGAKAQTARAQTWMRGEGGTVCIPSMALCTSSAYGISSVPLRPRKNPHR